jgi:hypothetical protein
LRTDASPTAAKIPAGYSTRVPYLGTSKVCQSNDRAWSTICHGTKSLRDNPPRRAARPRALSPEERSSVAGAVPCLEDRGLVQPRSREELPMSTDTHVLKIELPGIRLRRGPSPRRTRCFRASRQRRSHILAAA